MSLKKTKLLKDLPETSDAFGTHRKIADLLRQEIVDFDEGCSIALVGDWGSGKSTVIEILRDQLSKDSSTPTHVFIYDAWSHQGDSLRRAFLDDFITSLKEYLTEEQRSDAIGSVWNRTETTTTTREPILRRHAKVMLLSLMVVPIGMKLFQLPSKDGYIPWIELFCNNILALLLIAAPVLLTGGFWAMKRVPWQCIRKFCFGDSYKDPNFSVLSFFFEKTQGNIERKEIKSPVDSIGTFRDVFSQIVNDAHSREAKLRIIIVIDNIDRIPAKQAREFWSTMQTFFSDGGGLRQPHSKKYWLIAPFSVEALSFIFGDGGFGAPTATTSGVGADNGKSDKSGTSVGPADDVKMRAKAYIDKTFGLAFYVPPPILSNWRRYFLECLEKAFIEHDRSDLLAVRDIYDFGRTRAGFVTPRDIKLFVNSLVALYRQRGDDIPLAMMASYLLHREEVNGTNIPDDLIAPRERRAVGMTDWRVAMAALHFGVPLEEGGQLLLYEPIVRALRESSSKELRNLESRPGFPDVLRKVVVDELGTLELEDGVALALFAKTLGTLEYLEKPEAEHIWHDIGRNLKSVRKWSGLQESPADGIAVVIRHIKPPERINLCNAVASFLSEAQPSETKEAQQNLTQFAKNWVLTAKAILDSLGPADGFKIKIPRGANCALEIVKQLLVLDVGPDNLRAFEIKTPPTELSEAMAVDIKAGGVIASPEKFIDCVTGVMQLKLEWPKIGTAVTERMKGADLNENEVRSHLNLLLSAYGYGVFPNTLNVLKELSHQGNLSHFFHRYRGNKDVRAVIFAATILANPNIERPNQIGESQQGDAILNQLADAGVPDAELVAVVADVIKRSRAADTFYEIGVGGQKVGRFVAAVIGSIAKSGYEFGISPETIMKHWAYIENNSSLISAEEFLKNLKEREGLLSLVASQPFEVGRVGFYRTSTKVAADNDGAYWGFLGNGILGIVEDGWGKALREQQGPHFELVELVRDLKKAGHDVHLEVSAKDAVLAFVRAVFRGEQASSDKMRERLATIVGLLENGYKTSLARDIKDDMTSLTDVDQLVRLVEVVGEEFTLENESDPEKIVRRVFSPLVRKPTAQTTRWMNRVVERKGESFWSLPDEVKKELASRLRETLKSSESQDEMVKSLLMDLASHFNIDLRQQDAAEPESQSE